MPLLVVDLWNIDYGWLWYEEICSAYLLLGQSHILHNEWLGKWRLAQAQCLMHTTCRTQEGISWNFQILWERKRPEFSNVASRFYVCWYHECTKEKFTDSLSPLRQIFKLACWLAWGGSNLAPNLALLAARFSLESCYLPYLLQTQRNRSTTRTKVYLSQVAFNQWRSKQLRFKALLDEGLSGRKWLQKSGWLTKWTLFK